MKPVAPVTKRDRMREGLTPSSSPLAGRMARPR